MPRLEYVLTGIKRAESRTGAKPKPRLPVTLNILRAGEFTVPSRQAYDPEVHLNLTDLAIDCHDIPTLIRLRIEQSKTDPFRQGVEVFLGATKRDICPVQAILSYLEVRSSTPGALFMFSSGHPLTRSALVSHLHQPFSRQVSITKSTMATVSELVLQLQLLKEVWRIH